MSKYYIDKIESFIFGTEYAIKRRRWWWFDETIEVHYSRTYIEERLKRLES